MAEDSGTPEAAAPETQTQEAGAQPNTNGMMPAWVPEFEAKSGTKIPAKYQRATLEESLAEVAKGYTNLEARAGQTKAADPEPQPIGEAKPIKAAEAIAKAGLDQDALAEQWGKEGKLTDEQYAALEKAGLDRDEVDDRARGMAATQELARIHAEKRDTRGIELAGGKDQYANLAGWVQQNYSAEQIDAYNAAVTGNSMEAMEQAVGGAVSAYNKSIGATGSRPLVGGGGVPSSGVHGFSSDAEFTQYLAANPMWERNTVTREQVLARLKNSPNVTIGANRNG